MGLILCCFRGREDEDEHYYNVSEPTASVVSSFVRKSEEMLRCRVPGRQAICSSEERGSTSSFEKDLFQASNMILSSKQQKQDCNSDDDDVCPTCFEDYTDQNPKVFLKCGHVFHLSCIYEWMERSEACPFCAKKMLFLET